MHCRRHCEVHHQHVKACPSEQHRVTPGSLLSLVEPVVDTTADVTYSALHSTYDNERDTAFGKVENKGLGSGTSNSFVNREARRIVHFFGG